jgi:hypothetical protein
MSCVRPRAKEWGKPNLVCNIREKTFEGKRKHGMTKQINSQAFAPDLT